MAGSIALSSSVLETILDSYMWVIEGGGYGGAYYPGVPAYGSELDNDILAAVGSFTATAGSSTTQVVTTSDLTLTYPRLASMFGVSSSNYDTVYPGFLMGYVSANANYGVVRRIATWNSATIAIFTGNPFPYTVTVGDTFKALQGFRRAPDNIDIEDPDQGAPNGWDRFYSLTLLPGKRDQIWGNNIEQYRSTLELRVRFLKKSRERRVADHALRNMFALRAAICKPAARDYAKYVQLVSSEDSEPEVVLDEKDRLVIRDRFSLVYRVNTTHL